MAIRARDIYKGHQKKMRSPFRAVVIVLLILVILAVSLFYILLSFCVYDSEGNATIVFPFSQKAKEDPNSPQQTQDSTQQTPEITDDAAGQTPVDVAPPVQN